MNIQGRLLAPGVRLVARLRLGWKFALVGAVFILGLAMAGRGRAVHECGAPYPVRRSGDA